MEFFFDLMYILVSVIVITLFFSFFVKIPTIIIFIFTGFLIGPFGLKLLKNYEAIELISEIGVALLLFTIGLEFSFKDLKDNKKDIFYLGFLQVFFTIFLFSFFLSFFYPIFVALTIGFLISISSTAIILKALQDQNQIHSISGQIQISISIFQDLISLFFILILPFLKELQSMSIDSLLNFLVLENFLPIFFKIIILTISFFLLYKFLIPSFLNFIAKTKNKDLFVLSVIVLCFLITFGMYKAGLSIALGAFLAGLLISETEYSIETLSNILPFKIVFTSIFFVSIGMLVDIQFIIKDLNWVFIIVFSILVGFFKFMIVFLIVYIFYKNVRISLISGIFLSQIGEFSFIILKEAFDLSIIDKNVYQLLLSSTVVTMFLSIIFMEFPYMLLDIFENILPFFSKNSFSNKREEPLTTFTELKEHIVIIGYGINGRNVAKAAKIVDIPYLIIEMNPKTVREEKNKGEPILFGDATNINILEKLNLEHARMIVIVINDPEATKKIIRQVKKINPNLYILARTRYLAEVPKLKELGVDEVIPEEFETSIQIFRRILEHYNFSLSEIQFFSEELRVSGYDVLRRNQS
ncbi:MAG: cation:proton antiporter [Leptonema sp. (in: bacteria)]